MAARSVRDAEVAGSNPAVPTNLNANPGLLTGVLTTYQPKESRAGSDVSEQGFERPGDSIEIEGLGEERPIGDFAAGVGPEESPELGLDGPFALRRLVLKDSERSDLALGLNDFDHGTGTE